MPTQIDHVLIGIRVLEDGIRDYRALGFNAQPGGTHLSGRSRNGLVPFQDGTYLELISPVNPDDLDERWLERVGKGDGFTAFAVSSDDVEHEAEHLKSHGLEVAGVNANGRNRPDGKRTDWKTTRITPPDDVALPFLISDVTPRNIRVPDGDAAVHDNGVTGVLGLTNVVSNLDATVALYQALLHDSGTTVANEIEGAETTVRFPIGNQWLELVKPAAGSELETYLNAKGPRPYEIVFGTGSGNGRGELLPLETAHGARLRIVH